MRIERRVVIEAEPSLVWDTIVNLRKAKEWAPGFEDYPYISEEWPVAGSTAVWRYHTGPFHMDFRLEMIESVRGKSLRIGNKGGMGVGSEHYRFSFENGATTVEYDAVSEPNWIGRVMMPLLRKRFEGQIDTTIANLKRYCER